MWLEVGYNCTHSWVSKVHEPPNMGGTRIGLTPIEVGFFVLNDMVLGSFDCMARPLLAKPQFQAQAGGLSLQTLLGCIAKPLPARQQPLGLCCVLQ